MRIIQSKNYLYKEIIKESELNRETFHEQLQKVIEQVFQGTDINEAINVEFTGLLPNQVQKIEDYVKGALYQDV